MAFILAPQPVRSCSLSASCSLPLRHHERLSGWRDLAVKPGEFRCAPSERGVRGETESGPAGFARAPPWLAVTVRGQRVLAPPSARQDQLRPLYPRAHALFGRCALRGSRFGFLFIYRQMPPAAAREERIVRKSHARGAT